MQAVLFIAEQEGEIFSVKISPRAFWLLDTQFSEAPKSSL